MKMEIDVSGICSMCKGKEILDGLKWESNEAITFDDSTKEILIDENLLMHYIQLANPLQQKQKIRLKGQKVIE